MISRIAVLVLLALSPVALADAELVRDIVTTGDVRSSFPWHLFSHRGVVYFFAEDGHGREPWISDGTVEGTHLLKDLTPGPASSKLPSKPTFFASGELVYFWIQERERVLQLWRTDGTAEGTFSVTDDLVDMDPSFPTVDVPDGAPFGDHGAIFAGNYGVFVTDGTVAGTRRVRSLPGHDPVSASGGYAYFTAGVELWRTDGTIEGTTRVSRYDDAYDFEGIMAAGDFVYFGTRMRTPSGTLDLYRIDARTSDIVSIGTLNTWFTPQFIRLGSTVWALAQRPGTTEIWRLDAQGATRTNLIAFELGPGPVFATATHFFFWTGLNEQLLWRSDGSAGQTRMIETVRRTELLGATAKLLYLFDDEGIWTYDPLSGTRTPLGVQSALSLATVPDYFFATIGERVFLPLTDDAHGAELWTTTGTPQSTQLLKNIAHDANSYGAAMQPFGDAILFRAEDASDDVEPWISDGTTAGTRMIADLHLTFSSFPGRFTALANGRALFWASDGQHGRELWSTDGTAAGTHMLRDLGPNNNFDPYNDRPLLVANGRAFLFTDFGQVWATDGTAAGTLLIADAQYDKAIEPVRAGRLVYFTTSTQLWRSDGTSAGTFPIGNRAYDLESAGDLAFFVGNDADHGYELWVADGSKDGTRLVSDVRPGRLSAFFPPSRRQWLQGTANGVVIFAADDGVNGIEPWRSDGTEAGTRLLRDIAPGADSSLLNETLRDMTAFVDGSAYFIADDGTHGRELWRSDGTSDGTTLVSDIARGITSSNPMQLRTIGKHVWFSADDLEHGRELWRTTADGATLVADVAPGIDASHPREMRAAGGWVYFFATTEATGDELWRVHLGSKTRAVKR